MAWPARDKPRRVEIDRLRPIARPYPTDTLSTHALPTPSNALESALAIRSQPRGPNRPIAARRSPCISDLARLEYIYELTLSD